MHECAVLQLCLHNMSELMSAALACISSADLYQHCKLASVTQQLLLHWNVCVASVGCELGVVLHYCSTDALCAYFCVCVYAHDCMYSTWQGAHALSALSGIYYG